LLRKSFAVPALLMLLLSGCKHDSPEDIVRQMDHLGVYVLTSSGAVEVSQGAKMTDDGRRFGFKFEQPVSESSIPSAFVINMPAANTADMRLFLLPSIEGARWNMFSDASSDPQPLPSTTERVSGSIYKVTPREPLSSNAAGFFCVWLKVAAPMYPDRLYAVKLRR